MHVQIEEGIHSVLIVEDEGLLALMMEDLVRELGATDVHLCGDLASAMQMARSAEIDCAVLDLKVRGGTSTAIADTLSLRSIPFLYSTGSAPDGLELRHRSRPILFKPFSDDDFKRALLDTWRVGVFDASKAPRPGLRPYGQPTR
jgi:CheY-like chemotaxis protein